MTRFDLDEQVARGVCVLREVVEGREQVMASLLAAGFGEIQEDEVPIIFALDAHLHLQSVVNLMAELQIPEEKVPELADRLMAAGYLELRENPAAPGRKKIGVTKKGSAAHLVMRNAVQVNRWAGFHFRPDDLVVATVVKSGTTWVQMICALLIFQTPDLPAPLIELSPWLDKPLDLRDDVFSLLAAQEHRRILKTHLSLDMIPRDPRVTYIVVVRHPLDSAVSFYHILESGDDQPGKAGGPKLPAPREALLSWIDESSFTYAEHSDFTLRSVMRHLTGAWAHRDDPNVILIHYDDLSADLEGQMRRLAAEFGIAVPEARWPGLVAAVTFERMRAAADRIQPLTSLADPKSFFRSGRSGRCDLLTGSELARYHERVAQLAPPDLLAWLHREDVRTASDN